MKFVDLELVLRQGGFKVDQAVISFVDQEAHCVFFGVGCGHITYLEAHFHAAGGPSSLVTTDLQPDLVIHELSVYQLLSTGKGNCNIIGTLA